MWLHPDKITPHPNSFKEGSVKWDLSYGNWTGGDAAGGTELG